MKYLSFLLCCICAITISAQSTGRIEYAESIKMEFDGLGDMVIDGMPDAITMEKVLLFDQEASIYKDVKSSKDNSKEISNEDGSFVMRFEMDGGENSFYTNRLTNESVDQTEFMGKQFLIIEEAEKPKWKLTNEKVKYLDYVCLKAELTESREGKDDRHVVAWFTSEIPASVGPQGFGQLPGAILMVNIDDGKTEIKATKVELDVDFEEEIKKPSKGKVVTEEEFEKIVEERTKEMNEMYGGEGEIKVIGN